MILLSAFGFLAAEASSVALRFREAADMVFFLIWLLRKEITRIGVGGAGISWLAVVLESVIRIRIE